MISSGPLNAKIVILSEAAGYEEQKEGKPFVGQSGWLLDEMLKEIGIHRSNIFIFNVMDSRPLSGKIEEWFCNKTAAKKLGITEYRGRYVKNAAVIEGCKRAIETIEEIQPNVVIALGDLAMWALTGKNMISKWRGSILETLDGEERQYKVIPTFHPAYIGRVYSDRPVTVQDLRRAKNESYFPQINYPEREYNLEPTFDQAIAAIERLRGTTDAAADLEIWGRQIYCIGFAFNTKEAICIPFMQLGGDHSYWPPEEERAIIMKLREVLTSPETGVTFQNGHFDCQWFARQWGFLPNVSWDTMVAQHICYVELRKALHFQASMYCKYYRYWKDDGKYWNPAIHTELQYRGYNCDDCTYTYEVAENQRRVIKSYNLERPLEIQMALYKPTLKMMFRGSAIDHKFKARMSGDLQILQRDIAIWFEEVLGHSLNPLSNHPNGQMRKLFYTDLKCKVIISRKTGNPTLDDAAMDTIMRRKPLLRPLCNKVKEFRSCNTFKSNFANAKISPDGRIHCSINISNVVTYRFSTTKNLEDEGMNMQNIPKGTKEKD